MYGTHDILDCSIPKRSFNLHSTLCFCLQLSRLNDEDQLLQFRYRFQCRLQWKPQEGDCLQLSVLSEDDPEPQGDCLQSSVPSGNDQKPQEGHVYESREAAIDQLRRWAQRSGFKLMVGHTKKGSEMKGMSSTLSECLFKHLCFVFSHSVLFLIVRLDCSGPKRQRKGPYSSGQHDSSSKKRTDCSFHINIRSPQKIAPAWHVTSIVNSHNHDLDGS